MKLHRRHTLIKTTHKINAPGEHESADFVYLIRRYNKAHPYDPLNLTRRGAVLTDTENQMSDTAYWDYAA
jgi:hypothetical protein